MTKLAVAAVQHACTESREDNIAASLRGIENAASQGANLVVLQELHSSRYFCVTEDPAKFDLAETIPGPATKQLSAAAKQHSVVIVSSLFERRTAGLHHNTAVVFDTDGSIAGKYRKMHIPDDPGYYEKFYFTPGDLGFKPIETSVGKLGVLVCWDQWFPEAARCMALQGADILIYPTAIGADPRDPPVIQQQQRDAWQIAQRGHAISNGIPVVACNRIGREPSPEGEDHDILFWGSSFMAGPQGELIAQASQESEEVMIAEFDPQHTENIRRMWPFLRDRRIDHYSSLLKIFDD